MSRIGTYAKFFPHAGLLQWRLYDLVGHANNDYRDAYNEVRRLFPGAPMGLTGDGFEAAFSRGERHRHPLWRLLDAAGRLGRNRTPLLHDLMPFVTRTVSELALRLRNHLLDLVASGQTMNPYDFRLTVPVHQFVLDLIGLHRAVRACATEYLVARAMAADRYRERWEWYNEARDTRWAGANIEAAARYLVEVDREFAVIAHGITCRTTLFPWEVLCFINTCRLDTVTVDYAPLTVPLPDLFADHDSNRVRVETYTPLPFHLSGVLEGHDPLTVSAGLARTYVLSRITTEFSDEPPVPNGILADWLEDKNKMPNPQVLQDLRVRPDLTQCPTFEFDCHTFQPPHPGGG